MQLQISRWLIEYDAEATRHCYSQLPTGTGCSCDECRNFDAAAGRTFPPEFVALAHELGIDPVKPAELMHWVREPSGLMLTGGWFHFVGSVLSGASLTSKPDGTGTIDLQPYAGLELGVSNHTSLLPDSFSNQPVVELQFQSRVPWVLDSCPAT
jgi:hypothetical protein